MRPGGVSKLDMGRMTSEAASRASHFHKWFHFCSRRATKSLSCQMAPPTSVAWMTLHRVRYPRSRQIVVWALHIGPLFHI
jgi:hypothetical protein